MYVDGIKCDIDVERYLMSKHLEKVRIVGDNVMTCCPFHSEREPSFGVHSITGEYNCFGCGARGKFESLVRHLDGYDTTYDAVQHLVETYGHVISDEIGSFDVEFDEPAYVPANQYWVPEMVLDPYKYRHPYLESRGVAEKWQRIFEIGYDTNKHAVTFPYRDPDGWLLTVKFRSVADKQFWYSPKLPKRIKAQTLYGMHLVRRWNIRKIAICEAEIDTMSVWNAEVRVDGQPVGAVGIGGNQFNAQLASVMVNKLHPDTELIVFTDNDDGGALALEKIRKHLDGRFKISVVDWSLIQRSVKDANDLTPDEIRMLLEKRRTLGLNLQF